MNISAMIKDISNTKPSSHGRTSNCGHPLRNWTHFVLYLILITSLKCFLKNYGNGYTS